MDGKMYTLGKTLITCGAFGLFHRNHKKTLKKAKPLKNITVLNNNFSTGNDTYDFLSTYVSSRIKPGLLIFQAVK